VPSTKQETSEEQFVIPPVADCNEGACPLALPGGSKVRAPYAFPVGATGAGCNGGSCPPAPPRTAPESESQVDAAKVRER
jgi:hypothetical protein